jgi:hypothetical protein
MIRRAISSVVYLAALFTIGTAGAVLGAGIVQGAVALLR